MKHTEGEWINVCNSGSHAVDVMTSDGLTYICSCEGTEQGIDLDISVDEANARLIAAAPDLLAACEYALPLICGKRLKNDVFPPNDDLGKHLAGLFEICEKKLEIAITKVEPPIGRKGRREMKECRDYCPKCNSQNID